jgi:prepilin-type N-terminal cleavage/methylation domain-containing protein
MRRLGPRAPRGFTLVELLAVIAIIGILAAILLVAIVPVLSKGPEVMTTSDLRQLTVALNNFKGKYGFFPPSQITLSANVNNIDPTSLTYLNGMWPRLGWTDQTISLDWAGTGLARKTLMQPDHVYHLEGDQCLVFFLGGIPDRHVPGCLGFSSNPKNPTDFSAGSKVSFHQFDSSRLFARNGSFFYSFVDPWSTGKPYVFFSSGKHGYSNTDSHLIPSGPYYEMGTNPPRYWNANSFQLISAGKNGLYGPGGAWSPATATSIHTEGTDDQSNFYDAKLGVPK